MTMPASLPDAPSYQRDDIVRTFQFDDGYTLTITATAGTFTLTYNGVTTAPIPYNATAATIETALVGTGATVTGTGPYTVVVPDPSLELTADTADLTGTVTIDEHGLDLSGSTWTAHVTSWRDVGARVLPSGLAWTVDDTDATTGKVVLTLPGSDLTLIPMGDDRTVILFSDLVESGTFDRTVAIWRDLLGEQA